MIKLEFKTKLYLALVAVYVCVVPVIWIAVSNGLKNYVLIHPFWGTAYYAIVLIGLYGSLCVIYYCLHRKFKVEVSEDFQIDPADFLFIVIIVILGVISLVASFHVFTEILAIEPIDNDQVNNIIVGLLTITSIVFAVQVTLMKMPKRIVRRVSFMVMLLIELVTLGYAAYSYVMDIALSNNSFTLYLVFLSLLFTLFYTGYIIVLRVLLPPDDDKEQKSTGSSV
ncbi:MAG: hypothetical protein LBH62_01960 [Nitrososphaerota archaeon]|jgi:hypothetical protein|nr:hypothetical protein [Nitrososphaerota archaeon]